MKLNDLEYGIRVRKKYKTAFERQVGEAVIISREQKTGTTLLNSKAEYNRCKIHRIETKPSQSAWAETVLEQKAEETIQLGIKDLKSNKRSRPMKTKCLTKTLKSICVEITNENITNWNKRRKLENENRMKTDAIETESLERTKRINKRDSKKTDTVKTLMKKGVMKSDKRDKRLINMKTGYWREYRDKPSDSFLFGDSDILDVTENFKSPVKTIVELGQAVEIKLKETVFKKCFSDLKRTDYLKEPSETTFCRSLDFTIDEKGHNEKCSPVCAVTPGKNIVKTCDSRIDNLGTKSQSDDLSIQSYTRSENVEIDEKKFLVNLDENDEKCVDTDKSNVMLAENVVVVKAKKCNGRSNIRSQRHLLSPNVSREIVDQSESSKSRNIISPLKLPQKLGKVINNKNGTRSKKPSPKKQDIRTILERIRLKKESTKLKTQIGEASSYENDAKTPVILAENEIEIVAQDLPGGNYKSKYDLGSVELRSIDPDNVVSIHLNAQKNDGLLPTRSILDVSKHDGKSLGAIPKIPSLKKSCLLVKIDPKSAQKEDHLTEKAVEMPASRPKNLKPESPIGLEICVENNPILSSTEKRTENLEELGLIYPKILPNNPHRSRSKWERFSDLDLDGATNFISMVSHVVSLHNPENNSLLVEKNKVGYASKKERKRRIGRKKEADVMKKIMPITNFFPRIELSGNSQSGKRKLEKTENSENKKFKVGQSN